MVSPLRELNSTIRGQVLPAWRHQWHRHAGNRRSLWLLLAVLLFCWSALQFTWAELSPNVQVLNLMVWFGCLIALEDQLPALWPRPSRLSLFCGSALLAAILWRGSWITNVHDRFTYLLPSLLLLGLALLNQSGLRLRMFRVPLVISLLFPLGMKMLSFADHLQGITTMLSWLILASLGFNPLATGNQITLPTGSVLIAGYCTGMDQLAICLVVAVIFLLVFPLRRWYHQLLALLVAGAAALGVNSVRIAILALLVAVPERGGMTVFGFLHDSYGGLVFSLIAVGVFGWFYTFLVDRELAAAMSHYQNFPLNPDS